MANETASSLLKSRKFIMWSSLVTILGALAAVAAFLVLTGRMEVVFKGPHQQVVVEAESVCDEAIIEEYNAAANEFEQGKYQSVYDQIVERDNYQDDVNCVYITLRHYILENDPERAESAFEQFVYLNDRGNHVSDRVAIPSNRGSLRSEVERMTNFNAEEEDTAENDPAVVGED